MVDIVVCIKAVSQQFDSLRISDGGRGLAVAGKSWVMNESDEHALEQALRIKRTRGATITAVTAGPIASQEVLYRALAKGADAAIRIDGDEIDPNVTALKVAGALRKLTYDLVLSGVESFDGMASQVSLLAAAQLALPFAYAVTKIAEVRSDAIVVERELGGGRRQKLEIMMPALLALLPGNDPLSYAPAAKLVQVRRRPLPCWTPADLGLAEVDVMTKRKMRWMAIEPRTSGGKIQWLSGDAAAIADAILSKVRDSL
jgi:electron transfer flavoprotein beta subunit